MVFRQGVRPMKPLFDSVVALMVFVLLTVAGHADQYVYPPVRYSSVPMSEAVTVYYGMPTYGVPLSHTVSGSVSNSIVTTVSEPLYVSSPVVSESVIYSEPYSSTSYISKSYTVAKPLDKSVVVSPRLDPLPPLQDPLPNREAAKKETSETVGRQAYVPRLGPFLPLQDPLPDKEGTSEKTRGTIRGQAGAVSGLAEVLNTPPPIAVGPVEEPIDPKIVGNLPESGSDGEFLESSPPGLPSSPPPVVKLSDPLGYGVLLAAIAITTIGLIYMVFVAYDYRQRWVHSLTIQNDRYLSGGAFDMDVDDVYNIGTVSGGAGL